MKKIFVANLPFKTTGDELKTFIEAHGYAVSAAHVSVARKNARPRGFGFAEIISDVDIAEICTRLNGLSLDGRVLEIAPAHPRQRDDS